MATSGTIIGTKSGTRPFLELDWTALKQEISNNRTQVQLKLYLRVTHNISYNARYTGVLQGASFTAAAGTLTKPGRYLLAQRTIWINHNGDGTKTQSFSASYNIGITWSGTYYSSISVSGSGTLNTIPRASGFTAFGLNTTTLSGGTANTVTYTLDRKSSSFSHAMTLKLGSYTVASWTDSSTGARTRSLSATEVNNIINRVPNGTSGTLTLTMQTKNGSSNIGSSVSRTRTFSLNSNIKPTVSGLTKSISGSGRDKTINKYVQGISRVAVSFNSAGTYSSTIKSNKITISRSGQTVSISSKSGTSAVLTQAGTYTITAETTDSRGRKGTASTTIVVDAYSSPKISTFTANRKISPASTVDIKRVGTFSVLGGNNSVKYELVRKTGSTSTTLYTGTWDNENSSGKFDGSWSPTGNADSSSHEFIFTITDTFGRKATANDMVGTSFQELTIARGKGIGVGKVHERGVLDVAGEAYLSGDVFVNDVNLSRVQSFNAIVKTLGIEVEDSIKFWQTLPQGTYFVNSGAIPNQPATYGIMIHNTQATGSGSDFNVMWYTQASGAIYRKSGNGNNNPGWTKISVTSRGSLWSGAWFMHDTHIITPSRKLSDCLNGWMLQWSGYTSSTARDYDITYTFIPKNHPSLSSNGGIHQIVGQPNHGYKSKYLYVTNTEIKGHKNNSGDSVILRRVFEW